MMEGLEVNQNSLAVEIMEKVGPGGNYLRERHTLTNFKKVFYSDLFDRSIMETWEKAGRKTFEDRLREKTLKLMAAPSPSLPAEVIKELNKMEAAWK